MSDYISKQAAINWLKDEAEKAYRSADELLHEKLWIGQGQAFEAAAEALQSGRFDASNQGDAASGIGTEVLSVQLIDEVDRHAKTVASNIRLSGEAARLRTVIGELKHGQSWTRSQYSAQLL